MQRNAKRKPTRVVRYDGQCVWLREGNNAAPDYEMGSFLGGGAAGVVYEAECLNTKKHYAIKVLNPLGFKLAPASSVKMCEVAVKGIPYGSPGNGGHRPRSPPAPMDEDNVWWLVNPNTRQLIAAYYDARTSQLRELTLPRCMEIWGVEPKALMTGAGVGNNGPNSGVGAAGGAADQVFVNGEMVTIPAVPPKYEKFLRARRGLSLEIEHMQQLSEHRNILRLEEVLELVQDTKATIFLVLELAQGGELFDRIKVDCGADEGAAREYFRQLLSGVRHCHDRGVCHRDLKPENLLLADHEDMSTLKIADFGFSALFHCLSDDAINNPRALLGSLPASVASATAAGLAAAGTALNTQGNSDNGGNNAGARAGGGDGSGGGGSGGGSARNVRRLRSVVGSPFYVAPEVLREAEGDQGGYDGTKADVWSSGIILYAMLAGNMPFEKDLHSCARFSKFAAWARASRVGAAVRGHCGRQAKAAMDMERLDYPQWFFPQHFSIAAKSLVAGLLHPDPAERLSIREAQRHPWVRAGSGGGGSGGGSRGAAVPSSSGGGCGSGSSSDSDVGPCTPDDLLPSGAGTSAGGSSSSSQTAAALRRAAAANRSGQHSGLAPGPGSVSLVAGEPMGHIQEAIVEDDADTAGLPGSMEALSLMNAADITEILAPMSSGLLQLPAALPLHADSPSALPLPASERGQGTNICGSSTSLLEFGPSEVAASAACISPVRERISGNNRANNSTLRGLRERGGVFNSPPLAPMIASGGMGSVMPPGFSLDDDGDEPFSLEGSLGLRGTSWCSLVSLNALSGSDDHLASSGSRLLPGAGAADGSGSSSGSLVQGQGQEPRPPAFNELVKRSTRFLTAVPATEVLRKLADIVASQPSKQQKAVVHWDDYRLEVKRSGVMLWTAQIYLVRGRDGSGLYVVDFQRGQGLDIFHFKREYEDVRRRLSDLVRRDQGLRGHLLESAVGTHAFRTL